jgi:hypothetical protein
LPELPRSTTPATPLENHKTSIIRLKQAKPNQTNR